LGQGICRLGHQVFEKNRVSKKSAEYYRDMDTGMRFFAEGGNDVYDTGLIACSLMGWCPAIHTPFNLIILNQSALKDSN
jgi:hypothetical protein